MEQGTDQAAESSGYFEAHQSEIERALQEHRPQAPSQVDAQFNEAVDYALLPEGTRLRSMLTLLGAELVDGKVSDVLPTAAAVEFLYAGSRVFDDLPCMGDSNPVDKKEPLHKKFGEDMAILVGLGLLNSSYPLVFVNHAGMPERAMQAHAEIVECVGAGLIGGAMVNEGSSAGASDFEQSVSSKTSALIRLGLRLGAILSGADYIELANLSRFSELFGDVYLISQNEDASRITLEAVAEDAKRTLIENFPSSEARTCLIQLTDSFAFPNE